MHTVDLLDQALRAAEQLGYRVRREWLSGIAGGGCEVQGQKWLFLDLGASPAEHLQVVAEVLDREAAENRAVLDPTLRRIITARAA